MSVTSAEDHRRTPDDPGEVALEGLWSRLSRPFDPIRTVGALTGLPTPAAAEMVGTALATSPEADRLLAEFSRTVRSLATSMGTQAERCIGELRGTVLWSETLSARASSFGDPDLFVCATPSRAYDIDENRVLVAALLAVRDGAADAIEQVGHRHRLQDPMTRTAVRNGNEAARLAGHPSLKGVRRGKPNPREIKRTRSGKKRHVYQPALDVLARAGDPVSVDEVLALCDRRTRAQHEVLMRVVHNLESTGAELPPFRVEDGRLYAGPVQYLHPQRARESGGTAGVVIGQLLLDVPDRSASADSALAAQRLAERAGGLPTALVRSPAEVDEAVTRAIAMARS